MTYMTATPEQLRAAYRAERTAFHTASRMAQHGARNAPAAEDAAERIELIERCADKRGISLSTKKGL